MIHERLNTKTQQTLHKKKKAEENKLDYIIKYKRKSIVFQDAIKEKVEQQQQGSVSV